MAIYLLLQKSAFGPDDIIRMEEAYELALAQLGLKGGTGSLNESIAKLVIETAQTGEKDADRICAIALSRLKHIDL
jgi:hypothetical protein